MTTTNRCQHKDKSSEQCRLFEGHRSPHICGGGEPISLTFSLSMQEEARLAYEAGVYEAGARVTSADKVMVPLAALSPHLAEKHAVELKAAGCASLTDAEVREVVDRLVEERAETAQRVRAAMMAERGLSDARYELASWVEAMQTVDRERDNAVKP
jgi:hypothetical protein